MTRHPLFPAIVALWFGALFGLGSLAVRPGLIEQVVLSTHLDTVVAAAAPPIGMTARILLALAMTGLGGLLGAVIARRIGRPKVQAAPRRRQAGMSYASEAPRTPLNRSDYAAFGAGLGEEADDEPGERFAQKRRSLAVPEDLTPPEFVEHAPLPGGPLVLDLAEAEIAVNPEPLVLTKAEDITKPAPVQTFHPDPHALPVATAEQQPIATSPASELPAMAGEFGTDAPFAIPARPLDFGSPFKEAAPAMSARPGSVETAFASLQRSVMEPQSPPQPGCTAKADTEAKDTVTEAAAPPQSSLPQASLPQAKPEAFVLPGTAAAEQLVNTDLDELSPVQLVERLAITIERRRKAASAGAAGPAPDIASPADINGAHPLAAFLKPEAAAHLRHLGNEGDADLVQPTAEGTEVPGAPATVPAALRPVVVEADENHDDMADDPLAFVTRRHIALPAEAAEAAITQPTPSLPALEDEVDADEEDDAGYSSLLDLSRSTGARQEFVRIEDETDHSADIEPVVTFPGQIAPRIESASRFGEPGETPGTAARPFDAPGQMPATTFDKEESERALRAALATLQRMSGAA